jgi:prevent-host-death family protein
MLLPSTRARPRRPAEGLRVDHRALVYATEHSISLAAASETVNLNIQQTTVRLLCSTLRATWTTMTKTLTLREANQGFSRCIREVEAGEDFVITRNGTPVARLSPIATRRVLTPEQQAALERTRKRMEKGWDIGAGPLDRDALHER